MEEVRSGRVSTSSPHTKRKVSRHITHNKAHYISWNNRSSQFYNGTFETLLVHYQYTTSTQCE